MFHTKYRKRLLAVNYIVKFPTLFFFNHEFYE